jgi:3-oxoacyl-(acyl-carrier-protein) synthase
VNGGIAITGAGLACPAGFSVPQLLTAPWTGVVPAGDWFDAPTHLGARGWKYLTPASRYLLAAARHALADAALDPALVPPESMGVVVGTNFAAHPVVARMDGVVIAEGADELSPAEAPNFSVNIPASQVSMRYAMRAFNLSLTNPVVAGLEAVLTLASAIRRDRARLGIAGATEESPGPAAHGSAAEGACCLTLERVGDALRRGATLRSEVAGGLSRFVPPGDHDALDALGRAVPRLLDGEDGADGAGLPYASVSVPGDWSGRIDAAVTEACAGAGVALTRRRYLGADGSHFTVSGLLQVAGLVAEHGRGLVLAASPHGHTVIVLLRLPSGPWSENGRGA